MSMFRCQKCSKEFDDEECAVYSYNRMIFCEECMMKEKLLEEEGK